MMVKPIPCFALEFLNQLKDAHLGRVTSHIREGAKPFQKFLKGAIALEGCQGREDVMEGFEHGTGAAQQREACVDLGEFSCEHPVFVVEGLHMRVVGGRRVLQPREGPVECPGMRQLARAVGLRGGGMPPGGRLHL